jgi:Ca-activated chloride channel family protein
MGGASMTQARTALRLCLRQLREGDRFNIIAFDDTMETMSISPVPFTSRTLATADEFLEMVDARGGTELLGPLLHAVGMAGDGLVVLLTDGQVGNEDEIFTRVQAASNNTRISSFGIGTNVSTALLSNLAKSTNGALDMIYPGERIDEKVALAFARATAARITDVSVTFEGVFLGDIAPNPPRDLTDGEPWTLFGTYDEPGVGRAIIRGKRAGESFALEVPLWLPDAATAPFVERLWAKGRIKELERAELTGRRADAMKARIIELCVKHRIASKYASFIVVEKRNGDRRTSEQAETQVVPVNLPAGWNMFQPQVGATRTRAGTVMRNMVAPRSPVAMRPPAAQSFGAAGGAVPPPSRSAPAAADSVRASRLPGSPPPPAVVLRKPSFDLDGSNDDESVSMMSRESLRREPERKADTSTATFESQGATGLWGDEQDLESACTSTVKTLTKLFAEGMDASHSVYGAQIRKAIEALVKYAPGLKNDALRVNLLVLCWLMSGRRTRAHVFSEASTTAAAPHLLTEDAARAYLAANRI